MGNNASHVSRIEESAGLQVPGGGDLRLGCVSSGMLRASVSLIWCGGTVSGQCPASKDDLCPLIDTDIGFIKRNFSCLQVVNTYTKLLHGIIEYTCLCASR